MQFEISPIQEISITFWTSKQANIWATWLASLWTCQYFHSGQAWSILCVSATRYPTRLHCWSFVFTTLTTYRASSSKMVVCKLISTLNLAAWYEANISPAIGSKFPFCVNDLAAIKFPRTWVMYHHTNSNTGSGIGG